MFMFPDTKRDFSALIVATALILFICSFIFPFIILYITRDSFFRPDTYWIFESPFAAYILLMMGILFISIGLFLFLSVKKRQGKALAWVSFTISLFISLTLMIISVFNYYYFNEKGLYYNHLFSIKESHYGWDDFEKMIQVSEKEKGTTRLKELIFVTSDGREISFPFQDHFWSHLNKINSLLQRSGVPVEEQTIVIDG
ncbi:hypothetical protein [Melghiribacillus thermohalophilus]|nr:hypothetical protein [Melghiribacillus thermohalophilus]